MMRTDRKAAGFGQRIEVGFSADLKRFARGVVSSLTLLSATALLLTVAHSQSRCLDIVYVHPNGNDANDGASWQTAKRTIQAAVNVVCPGGEIWVAQGQYHNNTDTPLVVVNKPVKIYGDFVGNETSLSQRDSQRGNNRDSVLSSPCVVIKITGSIGSNRPRIVIDGFVMRAYFYEDCGNVAAIDISEVAGNPIIDIFSNYIVGNSVATGIHFDSSNNSSSLSVNINDNTIQECAIAVRISTNRGDNIQITSNRIINNRSYGVYVEHSGGRFVLRTLSNMISGNRAGVYCTQPQSHTSIGEVLMQQDLVRQNSEEGIFIQGTRNAGFRCKIDRVSCFDNGKGIVIVHPVCPSEIIQSSVIGNRSNGIEIRDQIRERGQTNPRVFRITNSEIKTNGWTGIYLYYASGIIDNCVVGENGQWGIFAMESASLITSNQICNNGDNGIRILAADSGMQELERDITITMNRVQSNRNGAIYADVKGHESTVIIKIINNLITHNTAVCGFQVAPGITLRGYGGRYLRTTIANNTLSDNSVRIDQPNCLCSGNGNPSYGVGVIHLAFDVSTAVVLVNNIMSYNRYDGDDVITIGSISRELVTLHEATNFIKCNEARLQSPRTSAGCVWFYHRIPLRLAYTASPPPPLPQGCYNINRYCSASYKLRPAPQTVSESERDGCRNLGTNRAVFGSVLFEIDQDQIYRWECYGGQSRPEFPIWRDLDGELRINEGRVDIGCDEFYESTWASGGLPDAAGGNSDADGIVNNADLIAVLLNFGVQYTCCQYNAADVDGDRIVNNADLSLVLFAFGQSCVDCSRN